MSRELKNRACAWCDQPAVRWTLELDWPACEAHGAEADRLYQRVQESHAAMLQAEAEADAAIPAVIDAAHLTRQRAWSEATFGPGTRLLGVLDHIRKELLEIEQAPEDVEEWVDVIILAFDGAWRAGWEPQQIIDAIKAKQAKNEDRSWPDWRTASPDHAIEHVAENADV